MKNKEFQIAGISILVEYKKIKNMYLRVHPSDGTIKMTVPTGTPDTMIRKVLQSKEKWILQTLKKCAGQSPMAVPAYLSGEMHSLWGEQYPLEIVSGNSGRAYANRAYLQDGKIILRLKGDPARYTTKQRCHLLEEFYREQLRAAVPTILDKCTKIVGKEPNEWRIKNMKTRWGTCNVQEKRIWLNLQLAKKPPECLEYVITHELVHLYERGHNARFWAYMDKFYPQWRSVRKRLNERAGTWGGKDKMA